MIDHAVNLINDHIDYEILAAPRTPLPPERAFAHLDAMADMLFSDAGSTIRRSFG